MNIEFHHGLETMAINALGAEIPLDGKGPLVNVFHFRHISEMKINVWLFLDISPSTVIDNF